MSGRQEFRPYSLGSLNRRSLVRTGYGRPKSPKSDDCARKSFNFTRVPSRQLVVNIVMKHTRSTAQKTDQENFISVSLHGFCLVWGHLCWTVWSQDTGETAPSCGGTVSELQGWVRWYLEGQATTAAGTRNQAHLSVIAGLLGNFVQYKKIQKWNIWPKQTVCRLFICCWFPRRLKYGCQSIIVSIRDY